MHQIMAEIIVMKTLKALLAWYCYVGTGVVFIDQISGVDIPEALSMSPASQAVVLWLLIVFWVIKISWFIYDKFHLERKERNQKMKVVDEEIMNMQNDRK